MLVVRCAGQHHYTTFDDFQGTLVVEVTGRKVSATALELGTEPGQFTTLPVTPLQ
ncbi:hypothetical protein MYX75_09770 [Acidobacteria bacterium AH-259-A15]|nr:hypothetical protein [Acidobacteria bacterium AH-259-A15]